MAIEKELLDQLLEGRDPETVFTQDGLLDELKKGLSERVLNAEFDAHLDAETADGKTNRHNGRSQKTVLTGTSKVTLDIPRDRAGTFDPQLIAKYQRRFPDFDEKIISMYARGMTVREIRGHLQELYGIEVSPDLISTVTDAVLEEVSEWQKPATGCLLRHRFLRRHPGQDPRRGVRSQQGGVYRPRHSSRWHQGDPRSVDRADRRRQVLAARHE